MNIELFKSMTYEQGKVITRQCNSKLVNKTYPKKENINYTKIYNKLGKDNFEKWFLINQILTGEVKILNGSNHTLRRLNYFANILTSNRKYKKILHKRENILIKLEALPNGLEKNMLTKEAKKIVSDYEKYINTFYDNRVLNIKKKGEKKNWK